MQVRLLSPAPWIVSSIGQSIRFLPGRLKVRVLHGPPLTGGASSSGRTSRFERENPGSNPGAPATRNCQCHVNSAARVLACLARSHGFESRTWRHFQRCPFRHAPIAQRVERLVEAQEAAGSKPARCTAFMLASSSIGRALRCYRSRRRFDSCLASHVCNAHA